MVPFSPLPRLDIGPVKPLVLHAVLVSSIWKPKISPRCGQLFVSGFLYISFFLSSCFLGSLWNSVSGCWSESDKIQFWTTNRIITFHADLTQRGTVKSGFHGTEKGNSSKYKVANTASTSSFLSCLHMKKFYSICKIMTALANRIISNFIYSFSGNFASISTLFTCKIFGDKVYVCFNNVQHLFCVSVGKTLHF